MPSSGFVWTGSSGCLLPFLIIFNLFFGRFIFNSTRLWIGIEAILILIFILKINIMARKIIRQFGQQGRKPQGNACLPAGQAGLPARQGLASHSQSHEPRGKVVDIQGQVVEEKEK